MTARILPLDSDDHQVTQSLLPWYINGTLEEAEASRVQAHLAQCPRCQADAAWQDGLRAVPADVDPAGAVGRDWAALRSRLDARPVAARRAPVAARWRWTRWLPLAVGVQVALAGVLVLAVFHSTQPAEPYRTLGAATSAAAANALVVFRVDATEAQIRHALRASDARLVGGPTVTDAYLLHVAGLGPQTLARLRAQPAVLRVESLESDGPQ